MSRPQKDVRLNQFRHLTRQELGRCAWLLAHFIPSSSSSPESFPQILDGKIKFFTLIATCYPCIECRASFSEFIWTDDIKSALSRCKTVNQLSYVIWHIHDLVNKRLKSSTALTWEQYQASKQHLGDVKEEQERINTAVLFFLHSLVESNDLTIQSRSQALCWLSDLFFSRDCKWIKNQTSCITSEDELRLLAWKIEGTRENVQFDNNKVNKQQCREYCRLHAKKWSINCGGGHKCRAF